MPQSLDALWGAALEKFDLDIASQTLTIHCRLEVDSQITHHILQFREVAEVRFFNSISGPWNYAELTEIHVNETPSGGVQAEIILWSESAGLVAIASSVELDGESVMV